MATEQQRLDGRAITEADLDDTQRLCDCGEVVSVFTWPNHAAECPAFSIDDDEEFGGPEVGES